MCCNLFLCILVLLKPSCKIAACLVHFGWPVAARMLVKSTWFFHETGKAELHLQRSGRDVIRCLICCSMCSVIIVEYLGDVLFCDPGWVSPNCRRHPQFMPALFSKSLRFRRLKWKMWLRQVVYFDIMPYEIDGATAKKLWIHTLWQV